MAKSGMFRAAFRQRRCLQLADGFYEWRRNADGTKTPHFIRLIGDEPFAFAGLYEETGTCCHVTTTPNAVVAPLHDRMPVILTGDAIDRWLDRASAKADLRELMVPYPVEKMEAYAVSTRVNSPRNDGPALIDPA